MRVLAAVGIVIAALTSFACGTETGSEDGRVYVAAISAALANDQFFHEGEPFPLPDAQLYVSPFLHLQVDKYNVREVPMPSDVKEVVRARFPEARLVEPTGSRAIRVRVHGIEKLGERRQVEVYVFNFEAARGHAARYLLERRGIQWRVVSAKRTGIIME